MQPNRKQHLLLALEDEPFPRGPSGESCRLKLNDWLDLATLVSGDVQLEVCPLSEIVSRPPDIIEAFSTRHSLLTDTTFPTRSEHEVVGRFSRYWPAVERAGIPAIGIIKGAPGKYPVFVRGEEGTFEGGGCVRSATALLQLRQLGRPLIVRPFVEILPAGKRRSVRLELRVHVVAGRAVAVEYLFPPWAAQRPTARESELGRAWTITETPAAAKHAERISLELRCRWFVADFAATNEALQLIELNPGWCAGIANAESARAVHSAILTSIFGIGVPSLSPLTRI
jgi:hypothetical protein